MRQLIVGDAFAMVDHTPMQLSQSSELAQHGWRGELTLHGSWEAPLWRYVRQALSVLIREWSF